MKIRSASSTSPSTCTRWSPANRPWPWYTVQLASDRSHRSTPAAERRTIASLRAFTRPMSTATPPEITTPNSAARRATWAARALATSALVGMQPTLTQVPPKRWRSITAVRRPAADRSAARLGPACPVPMMIASYACAIRPPARSRAPV